MSLVGHSLRGVSPGGRTLFETPELELPARGLVALLGPNGAGKTTFFHSLRGERLSDGEWWLEGESISRFSERRWARTFAWLPQNTQVSFPITVGEFVALSRWDRPDAQVVASVLDELRLTELSGRNVNSLSGGEFQRACLAQTLAQHTPILLLDEPERGLDWGQAKDLFDSIPRWVEERGCLVLLVTHRLDLLEEVQGQWIGFGFDEPLTLREIDAQSLGFARERLLAMVGRPAVGPVLS